MGIFKGVDEKAKAGGFERHPFLCSPSTVGEYVLSVQDIATPIGQDKQEFFIATLKVESSNCTTLPAGSLTAVVIKPKPYDMHVKEIIGFFSAVVNEPSSSLSEAMLTHALTPEGKKELVGSKLKARVALEQKFNGKTKEFAYNEDRSPTLYTELKFAPLEGGFSPIRMGPPQEAAPKQRK